MQVNLKRKIKIPMTPNFIIDEGGHNHAIASFTNKELKRIGETWIKELIKKAKQRRKNPIV